MIDKDTGKILNTPGAYQYMGPVSNLKMDEDLTEEQKKAYDILGEDFVDSEFFPELSNGNINILRQIANIFPRASYDRYPYPFARGPKRIEREAEISGIQTSITTGRKFFLDSAVTEAMELIMPGDSSESKLTSTTASISVKGTGYGHGEITHDNLMSKDIPDAKINGITALDSEDTDMTKKLVDRSHNAKDLWGREDDYKFEPGRYFLGAFPLKRIVTEDDPPITVDIPSEPDEEFSRTYPLLSGENHLHALLHLNWSKYTFMDIAVGLARTDTGDEACALLADSFRDIEQELKYHPYLGFVSENFDQMDDKEFLAEYLSHFFVQKMNQMYIEAQILEKTRLDLANRNQQNYNMGGHIDFDGTRDILIDNGNAVDRAWRRDSDQLYSLYQDIFDRLDDNDLVGNILKNIASKFEINRATKSNDQRKIIFNRICAGVDMDEDKFLNRRIQLFPLR